MGTLKYQLEKNNYSSRKAAEDALPVVIQGTAENYPYKIIGNKKNGYRITAKLRI